MDHVCSFFQCIPVAFQDVHVLSPGLLVVSPDLCMYRTVQLHVITHAEGRPMQIKRCSRAWMRLHDGLSEACELVSLGSCIVFVVF